MAKEFKIWDKAFFADEVEDARKRWLYSNSLEQLSWNYGYHQSDTKTVRFMVYEAQGFEDWQLFRVSMKGLVIGSKLLMLQNRYGELVIPFRRTFDGTTISYGELRRSESPEHLALCEYVRINNYIGALKRGGLLVQSEKRPYRLVVPTTNS